MTRLDEVEAVLDRKYVECEELFRRGEMRRAAQILYTPDACYLTGDLRMLRGREEIVAFFESIRSAIAEVTVRSVFMSGDPSTGVCYQFCNTSRRLASGEIAQAHYVAGVRRVGEDWLIEMEVPALGWIRDIAR